MTSEQPEATGPVEPAPDPAPDSPRRQTDLADRFDLLREAAIQAEYATGEREATEELAKRHVVLRLATIVVGFVVLFGGLVMMVLPGPGVLGILAGLGILSRELAWAERMIEYVKEKSKYDELKTQPAWIQASMWVVTVGAVAGSAVYFLAIR